MRKAERKRRGIIVVMIEEDEDGWIDGLGRGRERGRRVVDEQISSPPFFMYVLSRSSTQVSFQVDHALCAMYVVFRARRGDAQI